MKKKKKNQESSKKKKKRVISHRFYIYMRWTDTTKPAACKALAGFWRSLHPPLSCTLWENQVFFLSAAIFLWASKKKKKPQLVVFIFEIVPGFNPGNDVFNYVVFFFDPDWASSQVSAFERNLDFLNVRLRRIKKIQIKSTCRFFFYYIFFQSIKMCRCGPANP